MSLSPQTSTIIGVAILLIGLFFFAKKVFRLVLILAILGGLAYWWFYVRG